jgi:hypothetical protein
MGQTVGPSVWAMDSIPTCWNRNRFRPKGMLAFIVYKYEEGFGFIIK